jgi:hypothetical protein
MKAKIVLTVVVICALYPTTLMTAAWMCGGCYNFENTQCTYDGPQLLGTCNGNEVPGTIFDHSGSYVAYIPNVGVGLVCRYENQDDPSNECSVHYEWECNCTRDEDVYTWTETNWQGAGENCFFALGFVK